MVRQLDVEYRFNMHRLEEWLETHGKSAESGLAYAIGCSSSFFSKLRSNPVLPTGKFLVAIADATKIPIEDLVVRAPKKKSA